MHKTIQSSSPFSPHCWRPHSFFPNFSSGSNAYVEGVNPYRDNDGDEFYLLYNNTPLRIIDRTVTISEGNDSDSLIMKVMRSKDGDGLVALDSIISDHGFKKISLCGSINTIETDGPIGSLTVKRLHR